MIERWKPIRGYIGYYEISNKGTVKSLSRKIRSGFKYALVRVTKEILLKPYIGRDGYYYFLISKNGSKKHFAMHRLIATHFIPNPRKNREVDHIDRNRLNNEIKNLRWVTPKENINHARNSEGVRMMCSFGEKNPGSKLKEHEVLSIRSDSRKNKDIADQYNVSRRLISFIKNKQRWTHLN